jgi:hypothetical protein
VVGGGVGWRRRRFGPSVRYSKTTKGLALIINRRKEGVIIVYRVRPELKKLNFVLGNGRKKAIQYLWILTWLQEQ